MTVNRYNATIYLLQKNGHRVYYICIKYTIEICAKVGDLNFLRAKGDKMKFKKILISMVTCVSLMSTAIVPAFAANTSPDYIAGKDLSWNTVDGKSYWYEGGTKQGTVSDGKCFSYDGTIRGREIYDKATDGWYWLDADSDGAKAVSKEVFMPYIYQNEAGFTDANMKDVANSSDAGMADYVYDCIKKKTGKWVRYDENGKMYKGWLTIQGSLADIYPDQKGNTYYYDTKTGLMAKGYITLSDGVTYYFNERTGALEKTWSSKNNDKVETATIYYNLGNKGKVYAIEANVELSGGGNGYQAMFVIGKSTTDCVKFGISYEKNKYFTPVGEKCAIVSNNVVSGQSKYQDYGTYYASEAARCHLLMVADSSTGDIWFFHNYKYIGGINSSSVKGDNIFIRAEGNMLSGGSVNSAFKDVKIKSPVNGSDVITTSGTPTISKNEKTGITFTPFIANTDNGYIHSGVNGVNTNANVPAGTYGYLEYVNGSVIH